jgi:hypothetical protein
MGATSRIPCRLVKHVTQEEAVQMRSALKTIAGYYNESGTPDGAQAAAKLARDTLLELGLFYKKDAEPGPGS